MHVAIGVMDGAGKGKASRDQPLVNDWPPVKTDSEEGCFMVVFLAEGIGTRAHRSGA